MRFSYEMSCFLLHKLVLIHVYTCSPKSPPWNASTSIRIFWEWLAELDVNLCSSGLRVQSGVRMVARRLGNGMHGSEFGRMG